MAVQIIGSTEAARRKAGAPNQAIAAEIIQRAADTYGVSAAVLWGVWGTESGFGTNLGPSSAGAIGDFQFLPSTARTFKIDPWNFTQAANAAAKYLKQLGADDNPNSAGTAKALNSYSGGGGRSYVQTVLDHAKDFHFRGRTGASGTVADTGKAVEDAAGSAVGAVGDVGRFLSRLGVLFEQDFWKRVGLIALGVLALAFALANFAKQFGKSLPIPPVVPV